MNNYTVKYFIKKFEAIPEEKWCEGARHNRYGQSCALGHFDKTDLKAVQALISLSLPVPGIGHDCDVVRVNNNTHGAYSYLGKTPKQRILNALYEKLRTGVTLK